MYMAVYIHVITRWLTYFEGNSSNEYRSTHVIGKTIYLNRTFVHNKNTYVHVCMYVDLVALIFLPFAFFV